jgi:hypothetical protein
MVRYGSFRFARETDSLPDRATIGVGLNHPDSDVDALAEVDGWVTGMYLSDEWRPSPRLAITLGIRYDADINLVNNDFVVPWVADPELADRSELRPFLNRGNRKNDLDNISPRASFSWDVLGDARMFLRGGFGIIHDRVFSGIGFDERQSASWRTYEFINPGTTDAEVLRQRIAAGATTAKPSFTVAALDMEAPESHQWSIGAGWQIAPALSLNLDYIDQSVRHMYVLTNLNWLDRTQAPARRALSDRYGDIIAWEDFARARYRALLSQLTYRPKPNWRLSLAYTLGDARADWDPPNSPAPINVAEQFYTLQRTSGDERHRFVLSGAVSLPWSFTVSTITTMASPRPHKAFLGQDLNDNNFFDDDWIDGKRYVEPANVWRNWYRMIDLRLAKPIGVPGSAEGTIIAEVFNLLNAENFAGRFNRKTDALGVAIPSFGQPTGVYATREFQLGLRLQF